MVSCFRFISIPMLRVYGHYTFHNTLSARQRSCPTPYSCVRENLIFWAERWRTFPLTWFCHVQSFHRSRRPSTAHIEPSQRSYCVLQRSPAIVPPLLTTFIRPSSVQSSASLYRPSSVHLKNALLFIIVTMACHLREYKSSLIFLVWFPL